jgi:two-component sensor histidine kinase
MLHELATNALKYGALSTGAGLVSIESRIDAGKGDPRVVLTWAEDGGPAVKAPDRTGQGTRFIKGSVRYELHGEARFDFRPEGLRATIAFPLKDVTGTIEAIRPSEELPHAVR